MNHLKFYTILFLLIILTKLVFCSIKSGIKFTIKYTDTNRTLLKLIILDARNSDSIYGKINLDLINLESKAVTPLEYNFPYNTNIINLDSGLFRFKYDGFVTSKFEIKNNCLNVISLSVEGGEFSIYEGYDIHSSKLSNYPVAIFKNGDFDSTLIPFNNKENQYLPIGDYNCTIKSIPPYKLSFTLNSKAVYQVQLRPKGYLQLDNFNSAKDLVLFTVDSEKNIEWSLNDINILINPNGMELLSGEYHLSWINELGVKRTKQFRLRANYKLKVDNS